MKILIISGSGVIGSYLIKSCKNEGYDTEFTFYKNKPRNGQGHFLDITKHKDTIELIKKINPHIVFLTSAITDMDLCERNLNLAKITNIIGTQNVVDGCKIVNSKLVYLSTSAVFDGTKSEYSEIDIPSPNNTYGLTKLEGEKIVQKSELKFLIIRTDQPYGWPEQSQHANSVVRVIEHLKNNTIFREIIDWYNTPTYIPDLTSAIMHLIKNNLVGIFHITGSDFLNRYDSAVLIAEVFKLENKLLKQINSSELKLPAKRSNVNLSNKKLFQETGIRMLGFKDGLTKMLEDKKIWK
jgi:dTDP-4-dehydrorhamnose reductase